LVGADCDAGDMRQVCFGVQNGKGPEAGIFDQIAGDFTGFIICGAQGAGCFCHGGSLAASGFYAS
jgi:hypothetical protein